MVLQLYHQHCFLQKVGACTSCCIRISCKMTSNAAKTRSFWDEVVFLQMVCGGRCYVHMLNAACLSPFSVPCHRYHLTQGLFRGQLFQAIESRSKPALCFLWLSVQPPPPPFSLQSVPYCFWNWDGRQILTTTLNYKPQIWPARSSRRQSCLDILTVCVCKSFIYNILCKMLHSHMQEQFRKTLGHVVCNT